MASKRVEKRESVDAGVPQCAGVGGLGNASIGGGCGAFYGWLTRRMAIYPRVVSREPGAAIVRIVLRDTHFFGRRYFPVVSLRETPT